MSANSGPSWSDIAEWYDELLRAGSGPHDTAVRCLLDLVPQLNHQVVLDLACGQGLATRALAEAGALQVVGIDASAAMIELSQSHGVPPGTDVSYANDSRRCTAPEHDRHEDLQRRHVSARADGHS